MSEVEVLQQIDRLVSASSPSDALSSLSNISQSLSLNQNNANDDDSSPTLDQRRSDMISKLKILAGSEEFMTALCSLFSESSLASIPNVIDGGDAAACEFLATIFSSTGGTDDSADNNKNTGNRHGNGNARISNEQWNFQLNVQIKKFLSGNKLTHAILDLLSHSTNTSTNGNVNVNNNENSTRRTTSIYAKVSAIQALSKLTTTFPTLLHSQILSAPDGLHRIMDLLNPAPVEEESIRNEALLLCRIMAKTNAGSARLMIFGEAYEKVLDIAKDDDVDYSVKGDCLKLCIEMTRQDEMGSEVFLGNGTLVRILVRFLDLRFGQNYVSPVEELHGEADDLDDILNSNSKGGKDANGSPNKKKGKIPFLTDGEGKVTMLALELLRVLIVGDESGFGGEAANAKTQARQKSVLAHDDLTRLVIDMALYTLPPPNSPHNMYVSAVPTLEVQMRALDTMAALALGSGDDIQKFILSRRGIYLNAGVLDRLMYLICTGDGANRGSELDGGANKISMHCLGALRCLLSPTEASTMMMHTLAPPPPENDDAMAIPIDVPVVQKLVNTLGENLHVLLSAEISKELKAEDKARIARMIIGSAGALGIFFTNGAGEATREMLPRVPMPPPPPSENGSDSVDSHPSLMECMISYIETCSNETDMSESSDVVAALLRLLIEWIPGAPTIISALLSSASSIALGVLLQQKYKKDSPPTTQALSAVLLGLCMDNMNPDDEKGGWSIASIMNLINVGLGIGKYTQLLESLKTFMNNDDTLSKGVGPWACCAVERSQLLQWYSICVNNVRKKTVQELTLSNGSGSDSEMDDADEVTGTSSKDAKAMKKLVSQQTAEIDALRSRLAEAEDSLFVQTSDAKLLKKRLESNPSQLDDLMNEHTSKISELELQNRSLSSKLSSKDDLLKDVMKENENKALQWQNDLKKAQEEVVNLVEEKKVMQEEATGLTTAYTTLESEFNRMSAQNTSSEQTNGDNTSEGSMSLLASQMMKDENAKLKNNMRAANDWMKDAVKRYEELTKRNTVLETEIKAAQMSGSAASRASIDAESSKLSLSAAERRITEISSERDHFRSEIEKMKNQLIFEEQSRSQYSKSAEESSKVAELLHTIEEMKQQIETDNKQYSASVAGLEQGLVSKDHLISDLETRIGVAESALLQAKSQSLSQGESDNAENERLKGEINKLTSANKSAQDWMSNAMKHHQSLKKQVQDLKETNGELLSDLQKQSVGSSDTHLHELQKDLLQVSRERDEARDQRVELEAKLIEMETSKEKNAFESEKKMLDLNSQLDERQQEVQMLSEKLTGSEKKFSADRQQSLYDQAQLQSTIKEKEEKIDSLVEDLDHLKRESAVSGSEYLEQNAAVSQAIAESQLLRDENENLISQREEHLAAIEDMKNRLTEFHSWTETAQQRIGELVVEKESSETRIQELELELKASNFSREELKLELEQIQKIEESSPSTQIGGEGTNENDLNAAREEIAELKSERNIFNARIKELEEHKTSINDQYQDAQNELDALKDAEKEFEDNLRRITDLEVERDASQIKIQELEAQISTSEGQYERLELTSQNSKEELQNYDTMIEKLKNELSTAQQAYANLQTDYEASGKKLRELEAEKEALQESALETSAAGQQELDDLKLKISNLEMQLGDFDGRNRALTEENRALEQSNSDLLGKAELLDEVEENLFEKENDVTELTSVVSTVRQELVALQEESEVAIGLWKDKSDKLESDVHRLETVISRQEQEAKSAISLWEERCSALEEQIVTSNSTTQMEEYELRLSTLQEDVEGKSIIIDEIQANLNIEKENVETLLKEKSEEEEVYKDHINELETAIREHESANEQFQVELETKENEVSDAQHQIEELTKELVDSSAQSEAVVQQWQESNQELEKTVEDLEITIADQRTQATTAIEQWESRCVELDEQLRNAMANFDHDSMQEVERLRLEVSGKEEALSNYQAEKDSLVKDKIALTVSIDHFQAKNLELQHSFSTATANLTDANDKFRELSKSQEEVVALLESVREDNKNEIKLKKELEMHCDHLQQSIESLKSELQLIRKNEQDTTRAYSEQKEKLTEKLSSVLDEQSRLQEAVHMSEGEINELKMIIGQLEVELAEANDALQSLVTDEITVRATEKAAAALRSQIKDMRETQVFDHQAYSNEKNTRLAAEAEVQRLKDDLSLLSKLCENLDGQEEELEKMTSKAAAEILYKEREEIQNLQTCMEELTFELKASKFKEKDAEDRAANSRMHASVCEQELLSTKADIEFLRLSLNDAKRCESEMSSLLETRIKTLESDRQKLMNINRADVEAMKAELSNIIIERDQLIHALNESEKANSALVYSTTVDSDKENFSSIEAEMSKLRMENAQLLSTTSKTAARTERRIRRALAGDDVEIEDSLNTEKKCRKETERSLETLKEQYNDIVKEHERVKICNNDLILKLKNFEANNVEEALKHLEGDFSRLEIEKNTLNSKLKETISTSRSNITKLEERCKLAEAEVRKLKSAEHKEAALAVEVAKLREENSVRNGSVSAATTFDDMASDTERKGPDIDPGEQLDLIRELQSEMSQEREMYQDLLSEHEDLLALLAQQDCEKKCLQQALSDANGTDAVEKAILTAEERVVEQFGKYVQIK